MQPDTVAQLDSMLQRRNLVEALAQLTCNLNGANAGLSAVQNIIRPSQHFSEPLRHSLHVEVSVYFPQETLALQQKLSQLNEAIEKNYSLLMRVVKIDDAAFLKHFQACENDREAFQKLQAKLIQFKKQAHHSLAIRIVLQDRGVQIERSKLTLDQDFLAEKLAELRGREKVARQHFHATVIEMLKDNEQLMEIASNNPAVKLVLTQNSENLRATLGLLQSGNNIESLPTLIEEIHYDTLPDQLKVNSSTTEKITPKANTSIKKVKAAPIASKAPDKTVTNNFIARIIIWFSTSHEITWADTKHYRN
jgi:hypothetical protein